MRSLPRLHGAYLPAILARGPPPPAPDSLWIDGELYSVAKKSLSTFDLIIGALLAFCLALTGCYAWSSGNTKASYQINPDGTVLINWDSNKQEDKLVAEFENYENGKPKSIKIHVDKAGSLEALASSLAAIQSKIADALNNLIGVAGAAGKSGS